MRIAVIGNGRMGRMIDTVCAQAGDVQVAVSYTHLRAHET